MAKQQELIVQEPALPVQAQAPTLMGVISQAVLTGNVPVDVMRQLLEMQRQMEERDAKQQFFAALAEMQPKLPRIARKDRITVDSQRTGKSHSTPYAKLERIDEECRPILAEHGFSVSYNSEDVGDKVKTILHVHHKAGHSESTSVTLPRDTSGAKNPTQAVGSTISYGRRYAFCSFFNIITEGEDDDGHGAGAGFVTEDQAKTLEILLETTNTNRVKFLEWAKAEDVASIPASKYAAAVELLRRKVKP